VFLRYGYKKTSMDDLAGAAGISRQALYLHFNTKDELFRATVAKIIEDDGHAYRAAIARGDRDIASRLLGAFEAFHGKSIGHVNDQYLGELIEAASMLLGNAPAEHERRFIADITALLAELPHASEAGGRGTPGELADTLYTISWGLKHRVATLAAYRTRMSTALRIVLPIDGAKDLELRGRMRKRR
jgi:AcrR family transcriptional regulator